MSKTLSPELLKRERAIRENIEEYSELFDLDPNLVRAIITQESKFVADAKSPTGAFGYGQFTSIAAEQVQQIAGMTPFASDLRGFSKTQASDPEKGIKAICATLWWLFNVKYQGVADKKTKLEAVLTFYNAGGRAAALVIKKGSHSAALADIKALPANQRSQAVVYTPEVLEWFVAWHESFKEETAPPAPPPKPVVAPKPELENPFLAPVANAAYAPLVQTLLLLEKMDPAVKITKQSTDSFTEIRILLPGKY